MSFREYSLEVAGSLMTLEFGELAEQANASAMIRYGDTAVLITVTHSREPRDLDFLPLRTDYEERQYAAGRIPGGFFRREGRPSEKAILAARLIDRPLRPLFPDGFRHDVQVVTTVLSYDDDHPAEICAIVGASACLAVSPIPWEGPIGCVRVGLVNGEIVVNPTDSQSEESDLDLVVAGTKEGVLMVEAGGNEVSEDTVLAAIDRGHEVIREQVAFQEDIVRHEGQEQMDVEPASVDDEILREVKAMAEGEMEKVIINPDKAAREEQVSQVKESIEEQLLERFEDQEAQIRSALKKVEKEILRRKILDEGLRTDGRQPGDIREISCRVGFLPRAHGVGLFTRGQTQVLTVTALGAVGDRQMLDSLGHDEDFKRYMHHYNFPPYSVGEAWPLRGPGRREIGHGALAERALLPVLPDEDDFPYTIRLVSEVLSSNGSTSMGAVCGSSLSLMDAGVPIKAPVSGIAMGLIREGDQTAVLSDIQGVEDFLGDMDFKVAGTREGITAIQMDMKIKGLGRDVLKQALEKANEGRLYILDCMSKAIARPRPDLSPLAPRISVMQVHPDRIRDIIGPGGKMINKIVKETGVEIDIEDDGRVFVAAPNQEAGEKAREWIRELTQEAEVGQTYLGKVVRITNFGAFVEILPNKDGLVHISQLAPERVEKVEDVVSEGDMILVKVTEIDDLGRVNLSRKVALRENDDAESRESRNPKPSSSRRPDKKRGGRPPRKGSGGPKPSRR